MTKSHKGFLLVTAGLLAVTGLYFWRSDAATMAEEPRRTTRVGHGTLQRTVLATGVVRPVVGAEINVGSRISGTVVRLPVAIGDPVEAGQLLAELDATMHLAAVDEARAERLLAEPRVALAESTLERRRRLVEDGLTSGEELETSRRDLAVERARLLASEARLRAAEVELGYTRITAPISGVVAEVTTREGETVAADFSAPTFVTLVDLDRLEVLAYVDETDIGRVFAGQQASFTVDTYPDTELSATVTAIQPKAELQGSVVNYVVRLSLTAVASPGESIILRPEMTAHVKLLVDQRQDVLTIPRGALRRGDGRRYVMVERDGRWLEQAVKTGWRSDTHIEILSGLEAGETLELNPS